MSTQKKEEGRGSLLKAVRAFEIVELGWIGVTFIGGILFLVGYAIYLAWN